MKEIVDILSVDGGGIRGIIPAFLLDELEKQTGRQVAETFDLIAGTSTGGILALGLAAPDGEGIPRYRAAELVDLYRKEGGHIFRREGWKELLPIGNLLDEKYPSTGIENVLKKYFGEHRISQSVTRTLVTAYDIERRKPFFFKSWKAVKDPAKDFLMADAARATSAAPTYFEPKRAYPVGEDNGYALIDGGVFANNPAMCALAEAMVLFPNAHTFRLLSLGTGELSEQYPLSMVSSWGLAQWSRPILDVVFDGVSDTADYICRQMLARDDCYYQRVQVELEDGCEAMDDARDGNLQRLEEIAQSALADLDCDVWCDETRDAQIPART